jgi:hypothetical protein
LVYDCDALAGEPAGGVFDRRLCPDMPRYLIAVAAGTLLLVAVGLILWAPNTPMWQESIALFTRLGAIAFLFWLAWYDLRRIPTWLLVTLPIAAVILARWPRFFLLLVPVLVVVGFLRRPLGTARRPPAAR